MKKIILLAVLVFAGYKFYQNGFTLSGGGDGAFEKDGKPKVVLFVGPGCGNHCESVRGLLKARGVVFEEIDIAGADGAPVSNKYGVTRYPVTLIGKTEILGDDLQNVTASLAEAFGKDVLTPGEQQTMAGHFDAQGKAKVVMYATSWCPYCKQQREYFADKGIPYEEVDVEASREGELTYQALKGTGYPLTYVGYRRFSGYQGEPILAAHSAAAKAGR
jgi:glutaredoxin